MFAVIATNNCLKKENMEKGAQHKPEI